MVADAVLCSLSAEHDAVELRALTGDDLAAVGSREQGINDMLTSLERQFGRRPYPPVTDVPDIVQGAVRERMTAIQHDDPDPLGATPRERRAVDPDFLAHTPEGRRLKRQRAQWMGKMRRQRAAIEAEVRAVRQAEVRAGYLVAGRAVRTPHRGRCERRPAARLHRRARRGTGSTDPPDHRPDLVGRPRRAR
jgi:hypothetical protein